MQRESHNLSGWLFPPVVLALAVLLLALSPAIATAQSVRGFGEVPADPFSPSRVAVNAWLDRSGIADGTIAWEGDVPFLHPTGNSDPWLLDVVDISFDGNTAYVTGVVVHSVFPEDIGGLWDFVFTDNSGTGEPDWLSVVELFGNMDIVAGNFTVQD